MTITLASLLFATTLGGCGDDSKKAETTDANTEPEINYDRSVSIPGQDGKVSAFYNEQGVLSLQCTSDDDCLAAEGYFHAADRFFQMDLRRRLARGRLTELAGPILIDTDHRSRTIIATKDGQRIEERMWAAATPETKAAVEAYTRGVNAWIEDLRNERNGAKLSAEYDFSIIDKTVIDNWEELDSVACFLPLMDLLTNRAAADLQAAEILALMGPDMGQDFASLATPSPSSILPALATAKSTTPHKAMSLDKWKSVITSARKLAGDSRASDEVGSNNWVVGPAKAGGKALMANDPHLTLSNPAIWYMVHIDSKTKGNGNLHIAGSSFPGMPGILFGQNEKLAWGVTTAFFDQSDVYLETLSKDGSAVIFNGNEVPIVNIDHSYTVAGADEPTIRRAQYVPHHGPILSIDVKAGTAVSLRWAAQDADTDFNFLWEIWTANTTAEAKSALTNVTSAGQNFVVADTAGNIGWYPYNNVPSRPWMSTSKPWFPLPGDGSAEWGPYIPYADLPQATNPAVGYIATANNDMTGHLFDGDPTNDSQSAIQTVVADGYRHERISEMLAASDTHTSADMQRIQADTKSLYGERVTPLILADADSSTGLSANASALVASLRAWDYFCPSGYDNHDPQAPVKNSEPATIASAKGCAAFHVMWPRLRKNTFGDEITAAGGSFGPRSSTMALALLRPAALSQTYWDDVSTTPNVETRAEIVASALEEAASYLELELGSDQDDWRWGALHQMYSPADLFDASGVTEFSVGPFIHDGAMSTVDVAAPRNDLNDDYTNIHGASTRLTCSADSSGVACEYQLPGGQRHHRADSFFNSLLDKWLRNESDTLPFSIDAEIAGSLDTILVE